MSTKFVLNETSYFGKGAREELAGEIQKRGFKKVFLVSDKSYLEIKIDGETSKYLMMDGNTYYIIDNQEAYYTYQNNQTYLNKIEVALEELFNMEYSSGKEEIDGRNYDYDEYANISSFAIKPFETDSSVTRFYFKGDDLRYIKTISGENQETLQVEISDNVDGNLFQLPEGYSGN